LLTFSTEIREPVLGLAVDTPIFFQAPFHFILKMETKAIRFIYYNPKQNGKLPITKTK